MFGRKSKPPSRDQLEEKLESLRPGATTNAQPIEPEEVTGVIDLALLRLQEAQQDTALALETAANRLVNETTRTCELARQLSVPPKT